MKMYSENAVCRVVSVLHSIVQTQQRHEKSGDMSETLENPRRRRLNGLVSDMS